jgi:drug/metabolite transporter (DMT)-like permease
MNRLVPAAFVALGAIWGSSFLWIKIGVEEMAPATLVAYRVSLAAAAMLLFVRLTGQRLPTRPRELAPLAVLGLISTSLPIFLISWGELYIDSGTAAVLNSLVPIFSLIIAGMLLRIETVTVLRVIGVLTGFAGAAVLASREFAATADPLALLGAGAVALASLSYAAGGIYARSQIQDTPRYVVAGGNLAFGAIYMWIYVLVSGSNAALPTHLGSIVAVLWLGLLGSFFAFILFYYLISHLEATVASMVTYIFPVVGVALGVGFLGEVLDSRLLIGTVLVVLGIVVVSLRYDQIVRRWAGRGAR